MASLSDYARLIVPEYIPMGITGMLVGAVAALGTLPDITFWLGALCFVFIIAGYNSYNAIIDRDIDAMNKPNRPLPKGTLKEGDAFRVAAACYAISLLLALLVNGTFLIVALITVILTIAYSHPLVHLKRRFLMGTLAAVTLYTFLAPLLGWALYPENPLPMPVILFLFFFGLPNGVVKDYIDIAGDAYHKVKSLPVKLGYHGSIFVVALLYILSAIFLGFLAYERLVPASFLLLLVFYPLVLLNVYTLSKNSAPHKMTDGVFIRAMALLIAAELAMVLLIAYKVIIPEFGALVGVAH